MARREQQSICDTIFHRLPPFSAFNLQFDELSANLQNLQNFEIFDSQVGNFRCIFDHFLLWMPILNWQFQNEFTKSSFLQKYEQKIVKISALQFVFLFFLFYVHNVVKVFLKSNLNSYEKVAKSQDVESFKLPTSSWDLTPF